MSCCWSTASVSTEGGCSSWSSLFCDQGASDGSGDNKTLPCLWFVSSIPAAELLSNSFDWSLNSLSFCFLWCYNSVVFKSYDCVVFNSLDCVVFNSLLCGSYTCWSVRLVVPIGLHSIALPVRSTLEQPYETLQMIIQHLSFSPDPVDGLPRANHYDVTIPRTNRYSIRTVVHCCVSALGVLRGLLGLFVSHCSECCTPL